MEEETFGIGVSDIMLAKDGSGRMKEAHVPGTCHARNRFLTRVFPLEIGPRIEGRAMERVVTRGLSSPNTINITCTFAKNPGGH